jgi:hypothetical protein
VTDDQDDNVWPPKGYKVGYGRPPVKGRFVKRKSGNSRRPRKTAPKAPADDSIRGRYLAVATSLVKVRHGDQLSELSMPEAVIKAQCAAALKGSTRAQKEFVERISEYRDQIAADYKKNKRSIDHMPTQKTSRSPTVKPS